jgi:hypothetical protein
LSPEQAVLGLIGGVVGAGLLRLYDVWREARREKAELLAAVRVVRDELRRNHNILALPYADVSGTTGVPGDHAYRQVELVLARGLPLPLRAKLAWLYAGFPMAFPFFHSIEQSKRKEFEEAYRAIADLQRDNIVKIDGGLGAFMKKATRGKELELGPVELGGWQEKDPKTGLTLYDIYGPLKIQNTEPPIAEASDSNP